MRTIRLELLIATLALLASAAASIATVVQTRVVANQLSASEWPYLTIENTYSPTTYELAVINEGLGPAIVQNVTLSVDGERQPGWDAALRAIAARDRHRHKTRAVSAVFEHDFGTGSVVRAGDSTRIISIRSATVADLQFADVPRPELEVCYCSIFLQQCWIANEDESNQPRSVPGCTGKPSTLKL